MRENNRNSIASMGKLPQFTTMNVIDGQAGLVNYSSLIFYSLTIDNILNIIVIVLLAGATIATLTGDNGVLQQATNAKEQTNVAKEKEWINLAIMSLRAEGKEINATNLKTEIERTSGEEVEVTGNTVTTGDNKNGMNSYKVASLTKTLKIATESGTETTSTIFTIEFKQSTRKYTVDIRRGTVKEIKKVEPKNIADWEYTVDETTKTITINKYLGADKEIVIPNYIGGKPVKKISGTGFLDTIWGNENTCEIEEIGSNNELVQMIAEKITISEGIEDIGDFSFEYSRNLKEIDLPDSLNNIGNYALGECTSLTSVTIPSSVTSIGSCAFRNCTSLTSVTIPSSVTSIGEVAFYGCTSLTSVTIPSSVIEIMECAFNDLAADAQITCQFESKPSGWHSNWTNCTNVIWSK